MHKLQEAPVHPRGVEKAGGCPGVRNRARRPWPSPYSEERRETISTTDPRDRVVIWTDV